jgi:hypothetical protein
VRAGSSEPAEGDGDRERIDDDADESGSESAVGNVAADEEENNGGGASADKPEADACVACLSCVGYG